MRHFLGEKRGLEWKLSRNEDEVDRSTSSLLQTCIVVLSMRSA